MDETGEADVRVTSTRVLEVMLPFATAWSPRLSLRSALGLRQGSFNQYRAKSKSCCKLGSTAPSIVKYLPMQSALTPRRTSTTVATISAAGRVMPSFLLFPRAGSSRANGSRSPAPRDRLYEATDTSYMQGPVFLKYMNAFRKFYLRQRTGRRQKPHMSRSLTDARRT